MLDYSSQPVFILYIMSWYNWTWKHFLNLMNQIGPCRVVLGIVVYGLVTALTH